MSGAKTIGGYNRRPRPLLTGKTTYLKNGHKQNASPTTPLSPESMSTASPDHPVTNDEVIDGSFDFLSKNKTDDDVKDSNAMHPCHTKVVPLRRSKTERPSHATPETTPVVGPAKEEHSNNKNNTKSYISQKPPVIGKRNMLKKSITTLSTGCSPYSGKNAKNQKVIEVDDGIRGSNSPHMGPYLLKKARGFISAGDTKKGFEFAIRAKKSFENCASKNSNLEYIMCLHVLASMYWCSGEVDEAISLLERSIEIPNVKHGEDHALAKFVGCMRLGDVYATLGQIEKSIILYESGLEIQKEVLGEEDPRFGETCRYVAEAHVQSFQFDEAEKLCQLALNIRKDDENLCPFSIEKAANRRLMGHICDSKGKYKDALDHFILARPTICSNGEESDISALDCSIGDMYLALAKYDDAISSYEKALSSLNRSKQHNHPSVAAVFVHLAELYTKVGKFTESKSYCEKALQIYDNLENVANGYVDLANIYESMKDLDRAIELLQKALDMHNDEPSQYCTIAGIEAQMGVIYFMLEKYVDSYNFLKGSILKFQVSGATKSSLYGITLNQLGLTCVHLREMSEAAGYFEEAKSVLEKEYGLYHPDTLGVYNNLAATYEDLERWDDAIDLLEVVVVIREEILGTADPIVEDEKKMLAKLLKQTGRVRRRNSRSLEALFDKEY